MSDLFEDDLEVFGQIPGSKIKLIVLILSFNQDKFLADAVESVLNQNYDEEFRIVIHDDASSDNSHQIITNLVKANPDKIIGLLQGKNKFSKGVNILQEVHKLAPSDYVARLDADDLWVSRNKLAVQIEFLDKNKDVAISAHSVIILDEVRNQLSMDFLRRKGFVSPNKFAFCNFISTASVVYRVEMVEPLPSTFTKYYIQDWPLWSLLANRGKVFFHQDLISIYRIHANNGFARKSNSIFAKDTLAINRMIAEFLNAKLLSTWNIALVLRKIFSMTDKVTFQKSSIFLNLMFNLVVGISRSRIFVNMESEEYLQITNSNKLQKTYGPIDCKSSNWLSLNA
jgi:glycosyltransferase involved in cell wall biosynthesis